MRMKRRPELRQHISVDVKLIEQAKEMTLETRKDCSGVGKFMFRIALKRFTIMGSIRL